MVVQILIYWLLAQILGLAGLPLARFMLGALPDSGYPFAKMLGLLLTGYLAWMLSMLGLAPFSTPLVIIALIVITLFGVFIHPEGRPMAILAWFRSRWRSILWYELIFTIALIYLAIQRSYDLGFVGPNPWGTERPMDFGFFNAITRSPVFPPHDPWLAGFSINYYYFGYLLMSCVAMLSGLAPSVAYNLSLALIFALTAQGVAGIVAALVYFTRGRIGKSGVAAAVIAIIFVLGMGNQGGALEVISGSPMILALDGNDMARAVANGIGARQPLPLSKPFRGNDFEGTQVITPTDMVKDFNWWNPSRALWDAYPDGNDIARRYSITEFPFFSFWLGDMHPHVISLPFCLLAIALALGVFANPELPSYANGRPGWARLIVVGVALGALYTINSWDLPTYLLLFLIALLLRYAHEQQPGFLGVAWRSYGLQVVFIITAAILLFLPFHLTFHSLVGGKEPLVKFPILATITRTLGFVSWSKTAWYSFLIIFGLFLIPIFSWAMPQLFDGIDRDSLIDLAVVVGLLLFGLVIGFPLLVCAPLAFFAARAALQYAKEEHSAAAFTLAALSLTLLIALGTDIVYIRDVFENRMNTIFKFYYQLWLIWGTLAGYACWRVIWGLRQESGGWWRLFPLALTIPLFAGASVYPILTLRQAFNDGKEVGLQGVTPRERTPDGAASIAWLRAHAPGDAVIAEAVGPDPMYGYDTASLGISGVSASTGLATIVGWTTHQTQWRAGDPSVYAQIEPRRQDVVTLYTTTDQAQARMLLDKYHVQYVYIGTTERASYPPEGLDKFNQLGKPVFQQGDITIYQIGS